MAGNRGTSANIIAAAINLLQMQRASLVQKVYKYSESKAPALVIREVHDRTGFAHGATSAMNVTEP